MQRGPMENLFFMPAGRIVPSAPELLANGRLKLLLQRVEPMFDWIIIDTSPVIPVSDATLVAGACDGILMVVRSNGDASRSGAAGARGISRQAAARSGAQRNPTAEVAHSKYYYGEAVSSSA
jgi:protein-tyrosine kinase